jgi:hypothetical protein
MIQLWWNITKTNCRFVGLLLQAAWNDCIIQLSKPSNFTLSSLSPFCFIQRTEEMESNRSWQMAQANGCHATPPLQLYYPKHQKKARIYTSRLIVIESYRGSATADCLLVVCAWPRQDPDCRSPRWDSISDDIFSSFFLIQFKISLLISLSIIPRAARSGIRLTSNTIAIATIQYISCEHLCNHTWGQLMI